uniref:DNA repair protein XRCC3 isoform X2 n=1 Tax=Jaculus jaculus TaxID=51337 RepID=UPI001E1B2707|nr:DNA repair protein XRCC3 isoform X2 [Jaculus jaculus]
MRPGGEAIKSMDLDQLDLNPRIMAAVKKGGLRSVKEVLCCSGPDLERLTGLSSPDVRHLLKAASLHLQGSHVLTALRLFQESEHFPGQHRRLSLGCPVLDRILGGGLPLEGITELAGCSSAGKTQLALQLCLTVQLPRQYGGLETGAVCICTEGVFPSTRLQQLIARHQQLRSDVPREVVQKVRFSNQIFIEHVADVVTETVKEQESAPGSLGAWDEHLSPALGITWANQLLMRVMVSRVREEDATLGLPNGPARTLRVLFAPHLPPSSCCYTVNEEGVRGMPGTILLM